MGRKNVFPDKMSNEGHRVSLSWGGVRSSGVMGSEVARPGSPEMWVNR